MYTRILVPVDLAHADRLSKALDTAAKIAKGDGATLIYTGVTGSEPSAVAHNPEEYARKFRRSRRSGGRARGRRPNPTSCVRTIRRWTWRTVCWRPFKRPARTLSSWPRTFPG